MLLRPLSRRGTALCATIVAGALALSACSSSSGSPGSRGATINVVTSTDVYGDIASTIAGKHADVTSFIDNPDQDPHSYEANTRNQLAISKADVIVENGGGYDDFMSRMRSAANAGGTLIDVVTLSGRTAPAGGELNEHVWYDFPTVTKLATTLADAFARIEPANAATFRGNAAAFVTAVGALEKDEAHIKAADSGRGVAITEPVPLYLLQACGLVNRTPPAFSQAVEGGTDVSASVLNDTLKLFSSRAVSALVYNSQTSGPETTKVLDAAKSAGISTVPVTETLPSGEHYLSWMRANLAAVRAAVAK